MILIKVKKGYDVNIQGAPLPDAEVLGKPETVAVLPSLIPFIKPKLLVKTGDQVKIGSALFRDKQNPDIKFLSPGGGGIREISFGPRRVINEIVIQLDESEEAEASDPLSEAELEDISPEELIKKMQDQGLWPLIRALPFQNIADPDDRPRTVFVTLDSGEPFQPDPQVYLKGKTEIFGYGLKVLRKLAQAVYMSASDENSSVPEDLKEFITHTYQGPYPAGDPGVLLYHIKKSPEENRSWYIKGQDLLLLAQGLKNGTYPIERTVAVAGSSATKRKHFHTRLGVPLKLLCQVQNGTTRYLTGGIFRGYTSSPDGYMGFYETSLTLVPEGREKEAFGFVRPGYGKASYSRTFLSVFNKSPLVMDCNIHGDERACVNCGYCAAVCPVDILPQFTMKAVLADEVEEYLEHGLLDCAECGLCSYVCPSKIEICETLKGAKAAYYKETQA